MAKALRTVVGVRWPGRALLAALLLAVPRVALACPVCFGQSDSPMAQGVNMGIYFLLAVVAGVLAAFASFFIYLARRAKTFAQEN
jgi:hypothetical protein